MFKDLKVLELASVLAGPSVGQFFAELGADVIKVESLKTGGDVTRTWKAKGENTDDRSAYFCSVNWGKRSIAIDLDSDEGRKVVHRLAEKSDIIIASYKPGDAEKLGVDYRTLSRLNPKLIYGQITGYGNANKRLGYDAIIQAEAGFMFMNGEPGGSSLKMPVALMDVLAAHHLKEALLLAILNYQKNGNGSFVEVSLFESAISSLVNQATNWLIGGSLPQKQGSAHPNIAPYGETFFTMDNKEILLAIGSDRQFTSLCNILELNHLLNRSEYINNSARVINRSQLNEFLKERINNYNAADLLSRFNRANIPAGLIRNIQEVFEMDESQAMLLHAENLKGLKTFSAKGSILGTFHLLPPPHFGEHTISIIQDPGFQL
jgi:crotonobetainyl-CoA:carnitine CoA-transferase CaiB-like acyl-CoA transferase